MSHELIYIIPIGKVEEDLLDYLLPKIANVFSSIVKVGEALSAPDYAYNKRRNQYNAPTILKKLESLNLEEAKKAIGIVDVDLYALGLNFVFGEASLGGKVSLIALPRLRQTFYGLSEDKDIFYKRTFKEAIHELGHTFGLEHCRKRECVMHFSNSLFDTDYKSENFCEVCRRKLLNRI